MDDVIIKIADERDIAGILPLLSDLGYPSTFDILLNRFRKFIKIDGYGVAVAKHANKVVGFIAWSRSNLFLADKVRFHIEGIAVDEGYRGRNIGKKLMVFIEQLGPAIIDLTSGLHREKDGAHDFYKSLGYHNAGNNAKLYLRKTL